MIAVPGAAVSRRQAWFLYLENGMEGVGVAFEFDPEKSAANLAKHGIDFEAAQALWLDERRFTLSSEYVGEERQLVVGRIGDRLWAAAITVRDEAIRLISVRHARRKEEAMYGSQDD